MIHNQTTSFFLLLALFFKSALIISFLLVILIFRFRVPYSCWRNKLFYFYRKYWVFDWGHAEFASYLGGMCWFISYSLSMCLDLGKGLLSVAVLIVRSRLIEVKIHPKSEWHHFLNFVLDWIRKEGQEPLYKRNNVHNYIKYQHVVIYCLWSNNSCKEIRMQSYLQS